LNTKICNKCGIEQEVIDDNFRICRYSNGKEYFKAICRQCENEGSKKYNTSHAEERWTYNNQPKEKARKKEWKKNNKNKINEAERKRRLTDVCFKLRKNCSRAINRMLKKTNGSKFNHSILEYLPYNVEELRKHLEFQFSAKMTWDNYGEYWEIDHIMPQSDLPYDSMEHPNFIKCWNLNNLRPLQCTQNRSDGATRARHQKQINNA